MKYFYLLFVTLSLLACDSGTQTQGTLGMGSESTVDSTGASTAASTVNSPVEISQLRGQWLVVNYWAQWCKPCIEEIPQLNELNANFDDITVLGVNYDGSTGAELADQATKLGVKFANLQADPAAELGVPRPIVLPSTLIVNPVGQVVDTLIGPQTVESLLDAIEAQKTLSP